MQHPLQPTFNIQIWLNDAFPLLILAVARPIGSIELYRNCAKVDFAGEI